MSAQKIPYPPSPPDIPEGLTDYPESYIKQQNKLLAGLFVFLIFYIAMVIFFAMVGTWCCLTLAKWPLIKIIGMVLCTIFFLFLVKGFFKRHPMDKDTYIEIAEDDHPILFGFIQTLCDEIGAPFPNKVYLCADVNAACIRRLSLINLFVEPKRDLLIGLGLVNCMNLSEFKAVLAHEFGHFCQSGQTRGYTNVVQGIIGDMVRGEDWFDRLLKWCKKRPTHRASNNGIGVLFIAFATAVSWILDGGRMVLQWIYRMFALQDRAMSREREFHADKVAVSVAGSDASTHGLLRARFGMQCFIQAIDDLVIPARDNKQYSNDLYLHQDRAAAIVRRKKKEEQLGLPPVLPTPTSGKNTKVFDAEEEEMEDEDDTPPMWRTHPPDADREENAKEQFVPAVMDHRSPWILFSDVAELKERVTYKFYRTVFGIPKNADLIDALQIQEYIDNEHAETTYDPKYHGVYNDRQLEPGDLSELNTIIHDTPWNEERIKKVYDKLYEGCREHAEEFADLCKELESRQSNVVGRPSSKMKKMIAEIEKKMDSKWEWFKSFDRRVYLLHVQMAAVDPDLKDELVERYRFQLEVQRLYKEARNNFNKANDYLKHLNSLPPNRIPNDFIAEVIAVLRAAWKGLKKIVQDAREINLPAMKNFAEGNRLADFILDVKMVPEPPISGLKGVWVDKLLSQLQSVRNRCARLHFKSLGGILAIQEKIATKWLAASQPVAAEVIPAETVEAEVVPLEAIEAEVIPPLEAVEAEVDPADVVAVEIVEDVVAVEIIEDVVAAEVIPVDEGAELLPLDEIPAEVIPTAPVLAEPGGNPIAAFITTPQHSHTQATPAPVTLPVVPSAVAVPPATPPVRVTSTVVPEPLPLDEEAPIEASVESTPLMQPPKTAIVALAVSAKPTTQTVPVPPPTPVATSAVERDNSFALDVASLVPDTKPDTIPAATAETDNPFAIDAAPILGATAPATEEKLPDSSVAEIFALDAASATAPEFFSLDADADPAPAVPANPTPAPESTQPTEEVISLDSLDLDAVPNSVPIMKPQPTETPIPVEEVFPLDADEAPAPVSTAKPQPIETLIPVEEIFSLDADEAPAPVSTAKPQPIEILIPVEEVFPLDADEAPVPVPTAKPPLVQKPVLLAEEVFSLDADKNAANAPVATTIPVKPVAPSAPKPASGTVPQPIAKPISSTVAQPVAKPSRSTAAPTGRPAFGSAAPVAPTTNGSANEPSPRTNGKRPTVKITLVKPGGKSPFAK